MNLKWCLLIAMWLIWLGFIGPFLISAASTELVLVGVASFLMMVLYSIKEIKEELK